VLGQSVAAPAAATATAAAARSIFHPQRVGGKNVEEAVGMHATRERSRNGAKDQERRCNGLICIHVHDIGHIFLHWTI
jgi:hypothetical protein